MRAEYQRQLDAVTDYIYAHLDDDLSLDRLADVSGFSPYHWHRIYRAVRGETAAQTVRRLRLERAAAMLAQNAWPLERIARRAGFTSTDAFSRAFQRACDRTPGRFRSDRAGGPTRSGRTDRGLWGRSGRARESGPVQWAYWNRRPSVLHRDTGRRDSDPLSGAGRGALRIPARGG